MDIKLSKTPIPHLLIDDFLAPNECDLVWHELMWLKPKLQDRDAYLGAEEKDAVKVTQYGIAIEELLQNNRRFSDIVLCYNKIFSDPIANKLLEFDPIFNYIKNVSSNVTNVRMFNNFDTWTKHRDAALYTCIYHTNKLLSEARGGALIFDGSSEEIVLKDNQLIMFPSYAEYEFSTVEFDKNDDYNFTITRLIW
jgi:hypothetical protein